MANEIKKITDSIKKLSNTVKKVSDAVKKVTDSVAKIQKMFECPINLFSNLHICAPYYSMDFLFFILWVFLYFNMFIAIYIPIKLLSLLLCLTTSKTLCFTINPSDICISKRSFFSAIEQAFYTITRKHLLNRTSKDINKCYCIPYPPLIPNFVKDAIRPLTGFKSIESKVSDISGALNKFMSSLYIGIPIIIFGFIYLAGSYYNKNDISMENVDSGINLGDINIDSVLPTVSSQLHNFTDLAKQMDNR